MRDLANQSLIRRKTVPTVKKRPILAIFIVLAIVAVIWKLNGSGVSSSGESAYLKDAPKGLTPVKVAGAAVDADTGINLSTGTITLSPVASGSSSTGSATRTFGDGNYILSVDVTLPDPKGQKYQVWLYDGATPVDAGFMNGSGTSWNVVFRDKDKYSSFRTVWVTKEITSEDGEPELKVLTGSF